MRVRTVASVAIMILAALVWLALVGQPAPVSAGASAAGDATVVSRPGVQPVRAGDFRASLTVEGVLAPGALGLPGEQITWIITLANVGTAPGTDIILTDHVHDQLRIDSVEVDRGEFAISEQVVVFNTPSIAPGEQIQMRVNTTVLGTPPGGSLGNRVQLEASGPGGAIEDSALGQVFVPTGLPATGYPLAQTVPGAGGPSVLVVALVGVAAVVVAAGYVWWRGSVRRI